MEAILSKYNIVEQNNVTVWFKAAPVSAFSENGGACVKYKDKQIAVFNFKRLNIKTTNIRYLLGNFGFWIPIYILITICRNVGT